MLKKLNIKELINECTYIEKDIKNINLLNKNIQAFKSNINTEIKFKPEINEINEVIRLFKEFANVYKEKLIIYATIKRLKLRTIIIKKLMT